jgi:hypothetical protein
MVNYCETAVEEGDFEHQFKIILEYCENPLCRISVAVL